MKTIIDVTVNDQLWCGVNAFCGRGRRATARGWWSAWATVNDELVDKAQTDDVAGVPAGAGARSPRNWLSLGAGGKERDTIRRAVCVGRGRTARKPRSGRADRDRHTPQQPRGRRGATPRVRGVRAAADDLRARRAGELDAGTLDEECQADDLLQAATWASRVSPPSICPVRRAGNGVARDTLRAWHRCRPRGRRFLEAENRRWNR